MSEHGTSVLGLVNWLHEQIGESVYQEAMGVRAYPPPDPLPGCESGAEEHEGTHEGALVEEIARCTPGCNCPGYCGWDGEPSHDGYCDLAEER